MAPCLAAASGGGRWLSLRGDGRFAGGWLGGGAGSPAPLRRLASRTRPAARRHDDWGAAITRSAGSRGDPGPAPSGGSAAAREATTTEDEGTFSSVPAGASSGVVWSWSSPSSRWGWGPGVSAAPGAPTGIVATRAPVSGCRPPGPTRAHPLEGNRWGPGLDVPIPPVNCYTHVRPSGFPRAWLAARSSTRTDRAGPPACRGQSQEDRSCP